MPCFDQKPIKVGVFFGGASREREISFAGGRTVYDHLDKHLFEPVPVFVDSVGNFILLDWKYIYQGTIREFYPAVTSVFDIPIYIESLGILTEKDKGQYIHPIGIKLEPACFGQYFDIALLCLHGPYGEDGTIQGLLEWYKIPYCGSGILPSALCINKVFQKNLLKNAGFLTPKFLVLSLKQWMICNRTILLDHIINTIGLPFVVKSSTQGSSIGVSIVNDDVINDFIAAVNKAFFIETVHYDVWQNYTLEDKKNWLIKLTDIREGIGFPLYMEQRIVYTPAVLLDCIEAHFQTSQTSIVLTSAQAEEQIIVEAFIKGREFSCIVLEEQKGVPLALPPTEIIKGDSHFDYRAKYLPGVVRKQTPMAVDSMTLDAICKEVVALFKLLSCQVYARIDGFLTSDRTIILNDPNSTSGMHISSLLFHQTATIGLTPTQLLTFLIEQSLERSKDAYKQYDVVRMLLNRLQTMKN